MTRADSAEAHSDAPAAGRGRQGGARSGRMLSPVAYNEMAFPSLRLARSSRLARRLGRLLFLLLLIGIVLAAIAPWQQTVKGSGNVIAYDPLERPQTIEARIEGQLLRLGPNIVENAAVKKDDVIAETSNLDLEFLQRLTDQVVTANGRVAAAKAMLAASLRTKSFAETVVTSYEAQIRAYTSAREQLIAAADADIESAKNKVQAEKEQLSECVAAAKQAKADFERQEALYKLNVASELKFQTAQRKNSEAAAKVRKAEAYVMAAENDLLSKKSKRQAVEQKATVDIDYATAMAEKARGDVGKADSDVAKAESEVNKATKERIDLQSKLAQQKTQTIKAPFDGIITRIIPNRTSQIMKKGDPICVIVPDTAERAVEIWLDGNDAPLVQSGRHVRLQFEGWPAIQFSSGWPSAAIGTFGGTVVSVDATDNGKGKFRILVLPDETDHRWPEERFLRQGVRSNGWVLLDQVPLWYEVWRNMNGFPPVVTTEEPKSKNKPPKLPKP